MNIPDKIYAGDALEFTESFGTAEDGTELKASDGWTEYYNIINSAGKLQVSGDDIVSVADGDDHKFTLTSSDTSGWTAGKYLATRYAKKSTAYHILGRKTIEVLINVITANSYDFRTHARKALEAIEAAIERRATKEQNQLSISTGGGSYRAVQFATYEELIKAKQYYQSLVDQEIKQEKIDAGEQPGGRVLIRFE